MRPKSILSEKTIYHGTRLDIRSSTLELRDGNTVVWEYAKVADGVAVLPIDETWNVYLVEEWRLPWRREVLQIPAGLCRAKTETKRVEHVRRELRQEIGVDARRIHKMISYYASAAIRYQPHIYMALDLFPKKEKQDCGELISVIKMPLNQAYNLFVTHGRLTTSQTLIALFIARDFIDRLGEQPDMRPPKYVW